VGDGAGQIYAQGVAQAGGELLPGEGGGPGAFEPGGSAAVGYHTGGLRPVGDLSHKTHENF